MARHVIWGAVGAALLALAAGPDAGLAQDDAVCRENAYTERPTNPGKSAVWKQQFASRDTALMGQIAGRWYAEISATVNGQPMLNRQVQTFDASGAYGYQDETCSTNMPGAPCSQNQGFGRWAAITMGDGSIYIARNFSDLNRQDECAGFGVVFPDANTMLDPATGNVTMRRIQ